MRLFLLLVAAPLLASFTQPPSPPAKSARPIAAVDSHIARHPKTKASTVRAKSAEASADQAAPARVTQTPVPAVKPAAKARKP